MSCRSDNSTTTLPQEPLRTSRPEWSVTVLHDPGGGPQEPYTLTATETDIGRASRIALRNEYVSRRHATLRIDENGALFIRDRKSKSGVRVNDRTISDETELREGNQIEIGNAILLVRRRLVSAEIKVPNVIAPAAPGPAELEDMAGRMSLREMARVLTAKYGDGYSRRSLTRKLQHLGIAYRADSSG